MTGATARSEGTRGTLLVVDDERDILIALQDLFEEQYKVIATTSPEEALAVLEAGADVSVILSDQRMPEMPGNVFIARARALCDAEAILLTGYADMDAVIAAINDGRVTGYVHKPWEPEALRAMVSLAHGRRNLARALEVERSLFAGLLAGSRDAITLVDGEGRVQRLNMAKADRLDIDPADAIGRPLVELEGAPGLREEGTGLEERLEPDGERRLLRVQRILLPDGHDRALTLTLETDVTPERQLEQRLRQAEKLQALGTLAGGIAHDFNNLLTAVIGNLDLARRRPDHPSVGRFVTAAMEAATRGASLTRRLLSFSRQRDMTAEPVDVNLLLRGMDDLVRRTLGGPVTLDLALDPDAGIIQTDPGQLELAILNLCVNARDAMPDGGRIRIATALLHQTEPATDGLHAGEYAAVSVSDEGVGMAREVLARAFEPFFTTKDVGKGTGLGLSMAYGLATGSGGTVRITSQEGRGTVVTLLLPRASGAATGPSMADVPAAPGRALSVLLVEDDPAVREVTRGYLDELGHHPQAVASAEAACTRLAGDEAFDVLLTDYAMPGANGLALVEAARTLRPGLPCLLASGFANAAAIPASVQRLAKPFTAEELDRALAIATSA